jgi:hypothetical protein
MASYTQEHFEPRSERGEGWVAFAGVMILISGILNVIDGIAAIDKANFFVNNANYVISNLNTWGWIHLGLGIVLLLAGLGIFARNRLAAWAGILFASVNAVTQLLFIPAYPFWSLAIFTLDILVVYGLVAYARHPAAT